MDSPDNTSLYANILQFDSNFEAQFLEKSQNTPMSIQDSSPELEIVTPKTTTWGGNFSVEKDFLLVSAWLNTSVDPMHGNEQKQEIFTAKIWQYFCMHNTYGIERSSSSLKIQWSTINRETSKFCGVMAKIEAKNQSDATDKDKSKVEAHETYFIQKRDNAQRLGLSLLQKMTVVVRMLAYGVTTDFMDEYVQIRESTAMESLKIFGVAVVDIFSKEYLRSPNNEDISRLLAHG
ncbi:hypothetical protein SO802_012758 [Lithocarpus litseifolius]|uniref:Uncharacterized protein n=1 Tax=Lithocarpus litseifolius TaxID=425828 RepID=A0AAW2D3N5_9ROSI